MELIQSLDYDILSSFAPIMCLTGVLPSPTPAAINVSVYDAVVRVLSLKLPPSASLYPRVQLWTRMTCQSNRDLTVARHLEVVLRTVWFPVVVLLTTADQFTFGSHHNYVSSWNSRCHYYLIIMCNCGL